MFERLFWDEKLIIGLIVVLAVGLGVSLTYIFTPKYQVVDPGTKFWMPICVDDYCDVLEVMLEYDNEYVAVPKIQVNTENKTWEAKPTRITDVSGLIME